MFKRVDTRRPWFLLRSFLHNSKSANLKWPQRHSSSTVQCFLGGGWSVSKDIMGYATTCVQHRCRWFILTGILVLVFWPPYQIQSTPNIQTISNHAAINQPMLDPQERRAELMTWPEASRPQLHPPSDRPGMSVDVVNVSEQLRIILFRILQYLDLKFIFHD